MTVEEELKQLTEKARIEGTLSREDINRMATLSWQLEREKKQGIHPRTSIEKPSADHDEHDTIHIDVTLDSIMDAITSLSREVDAVNSKLDTVIKKLDDIEKSTNVISSISNDLDSVASDVRSIYNSID